MKKDMLKRLEHTDCSLNSSLFYYQLRLVLLKSSTLPQRGSVAEERALNWDSLGQLWSDRG